MFIAVFIVSKAKPRLQRNLRPAMNETIAFLPGLSPITGKELCQFLDKKASKPVFTIL